MPFWPPTLVVQDVPGDLVWTLQHVLAEDCRCSAKIIASLLARESRSDVLEAVTLLSGSEATARSLREKGYDARIVDSDSLCGAYAIAAVPFFQVIGPDHTLWHSGSYFSGSARIGSKTAVVEALDGAMKGEHVPSRPIFGCAVSESLRSRLDPFRLKYLDKSSET